MLTPIPAISVDARAPWRSTEEGHQPAWALREGFLEEGTSNPTLGMGVGVARWNRMWGKSIQGRGSACAKAQKRESGAFGHRKFSPWWKCRVGSRARGETGLFGRPRGGEKCTDTTVVDTPTPGAQSCGSASRWGGKSTERGRVPLGGDGEKGLRCWGVYKAFKAGASLRVASLPGALVRRPLWNLLRNRTLCHSHS